MADADATEIARLRELAFKFIAADSMQPVHAIGQIMKTLLDALEAHKAALETTTELIRTLVACGALELLPDGPRLRPKVHTVLADPLALSASAEWRALQAVAEALQGRVYADLRLTDEERRALSALAAARSVKP